MNRAIVLVGLFLCSTLAPAAFADVPGVSREARQRMFEERMRAERQQGLVDATVQGATGGVQVVFRLAGPGTCDYALVDAQNRGAPLPPVAKGHLSAEGAGRHELKEKAAIAPEPEENVLHRYRLEALCRVRLVEQTNFGAKETGQVEDVRVRHAFGLRRERVYRVSP